MAFSTPFSFLGTRPLPPASSLPFSSSSPLAPPAKRSFSLATTRANSDEEQQQPENAAVDDSDFEARLARLQRKVASGTGKKAEKRRARKEGLDLPSVKSKGSVLLPPAPLKDPISNGFKVELGFNPYTERLNGRFAALGLAAVLLVELATGGSFLKYHGPATLGVQVYFMLAVAALYIKYEKEKSSVWPKN